MQSSFQNTSGAELLNRPLFKAAFFTVAIVFAAAMGFLGIKVGMLLLGLPLAIFFVAGIFIKPQVGLIASLVLSFLISGLGRYLAAPWGLGIDVFLFLAWLGLFFSKFRETKWGAIRNDLSLWGLIWFGYVVLELGNPEMRSATAWFYAMRGIGFYQLLAFTLTLMYFRHPRHLDLFLKIIVWLSIFGTLWGLRQKIFGTDAAEDHWLWVEGHYDEHVLFGVLRVFSFYSDAGQFGASQAMFFLSCGIISLGPLKKKQRIFYALAAVLTFIGFGISGTRGALAVPAGGAIIYMIISKNFKILIAGVLAMGLTFYFLKYTHVLHGVEQVRRMRTALADDNPSLNARLRNQVTFGNYLRSRPFGGGIGTAGFWGNRFSPNTLLADTPTDSYYVKIWAETGLVGILLHMMMLGYFLGKGGFIVWHLRDPVLRSKIMALYCGFGGVMLGSYGNQVLSQMPTGMIMSIALPLIFLAPHFDNLIQKEKENNANHDHNSH